MNLKHIWIFLFTCFVLLSNSAAEENTQAQLHAPLSQSSVEEYFDKQIQPAIDKNEIIGAIVAIVQRDKTLLIKGYGITDITDIKHKKVDTVHTLFRTASVTKIFVSMAAMQMIDEGKLKIEGNVNDFLRSFQVPSIGEQPLTIRHLLSHQGGFDTDISNIMVSNNSQISTSDEQIINSLIPINPPGQYAVYDNFGVGLLGMVMSEVDGKLLEEVIDERILKPLGMNNSVIGVPDVRMQDVQKCHEIIDNRWVSCGVLLMRESVKGAGSLSVTGSDMGIFLTALLNETRHSNGRILSEEAFAEFINMDLNRNHPLLSGIGRLTLEIPPVGSGMYGHSGHVPGFESSLIVSPYDNLAVYISVNGHSPWKRNLFDWIKGESDKQQKASQTSRNVASSSWKFLQKHNPNAKANERSLNYPGVAELTPFTDAEIQEFSGQYISMRARTTSHLSALFLNSLKGGIELEFAANNSFSIDGKGKYVQQLPRLFIDGESGRKWTFLSTDIGTILAGGLGSEHLKLAWHQRAWINIWIGIIATFLLFVCICWLLLNSQKHMERRFAFSVALALILLVTGILLEFNFGQFLASNAFLSNLALIWRSVLAALSIFFLLVPILSFYYIEKPFHKSLSYFISILSIAVATWQFYWGMAF